MVEAVATLKYAGFSSYKGRLVANQIRGLSVDRALDILTFEQRKAARVIKKVLNSAIANAENNFGADINQLRVATISVDNGSMLKRINTRAKGRADRIVKRTCHIKVILSDQ